MSEKIIDIRTARTHFSRLIARVERGERIVIVRARKAIAELRPVLNMKKHHRPLDDPFLRVEEYSHDDPIGPTDNEDIDCTVCGN